MPKCCDLSILLNREQTYLCSYANQIFKNVYVTESFEIFLIIFTLNEFTLITAQKNLKTLSYSIITE